MKTTATDLLDLSEVGRVTVAGTQYVAYHDGAYTCVVLADDWDAELDSDDYPDDDEANSSGENAYDVWCRRVDMVQDEAVLQAMANATGRNVFDGCYFVEPEKSVVSD